MHASAQVQATVVGFAYGPRTILHDISLTLAPGDRLGVVGPNGTGKSTLLRLLADELTPAAGSVTTNPPSATVGLMHQQLDDAPGETVGDYIGRVTGVAAIIAEFDAAIAAMTEAKPGADERYDVALERYLQTDAATFVDRAAPTLEAVGLSTVSVTDRTDQLSGGQRTKVNLAAILLASFDVLLLDEPTNDLDRTGLELLEDMLLSSDRAIAVVSHDRAFLERIVTAVFELDDHAHTGSRFNGGFTAWQQNRATQRQQHADAYQEYNTKRASLQQRATTQQEWSTAGARRAKTDKSEADKFVRAHRIGSSEKLAGKAKQTQRAIERLERNEKVEAPWQPWELRLNFAEALRSSSEVAALQAAVVRRGSFTLGPIDALVTAGDRILITGENGAGKTTLLRALLGELELESGQQRLGPSVELAILRQQRALFADAPSLLRGFTDASGCDDPEARSQLAKLGLDKARIERPVADLSPGEQTRAALGLFAALGSNVLVLDEPTNHLDLPAIEQLEAAIEIFPHTVLLVSHDRRLIENATMNRHWHIEAGQLTEE